MTRLISKSVKGQPRIEVLDLVLDKKYYRLTQIKLKKSIYKRSSKKKEDKFYIIWHNQDDFKSGFSKLKRRYDFQNIDIKDISGTTAHRYVSTSFTAKGFKP